MNNRLNLVSVILFSVFSITACNASSSDAKKVDVKKVSAETVENVEAAAPSIPGIKNNKADADNANKLADDTPEFVKGKHYVEINPTMTTDSPAGKVEVVEIMWLGCPHCYTIEPIMQEYKKNRPDFVDFKQVPAMLNSGWARDGKTYVIAEILDPKGEKHLIAQIFQAIHEQRRRLSKPESAKRFFLQKGFTEEQYNNAKDSLAFKARIRRAQEISAGSQTQSVPAVIINGKYRTSPYMAGSEEKLMQIIDMLTRLEKK